MLETATTSIITNSMNVLETGVLALWPGSKTMAVQAMP